MTQTNSVALVWRPAADNTRTSGARTRAMTPQETLLPSSISAVAENVVQVSENGTGDGGALLPRMRSRIADYMGRVLLFKSSGLTSELDVADESRLQVEPHLDAIRWIKDATGFPQKRIAKLIGVSRQAINLWDRGERIADDNRRRLLAVYDVLIRAAKRHPSPAQLAAWLDTPRGSDGRTPAELLEAGEIDRARLLAITTPSPRVSRTPLRVRHPVANAFRDGADRRQEALPPDHDDELFAQFGDPGSDQDE